MHARGAPGAGAGTAQNAAAAGHRPGAGQNPGSLSDLKNRSENSAGRGQILQVLQVNSRSIDQKSGEICTGQTDLQPISFKSGRLLKALPHV